MFLWYIQCSSCMNRWAAAYASPTLYCFRSFLILFNSVRPLSSFRLWIESNVGLYENGTDGTCLGDRGTEIGRASWYFIRHLAFRVYVPLQKLKQDPRYKKTWCPKCYERMTCSRSLTEKNDCGKTCGYTLLSTYAYTLRKVFLP